MSKNTPNTIYLSGKNLSLGQVLDFSYSPDSYVFKTEPSARLRMIEARKKVLDIVKEGKPVYGINTGFGALASKFISSEHLEELQYNLIRSHCTGVGEPYSLPLTRAIMLIRANCLISGYSGVNPDIVDLILEFLNNKVYPIIPQKGSVGASGDLAPLAHLALALIGESDVVYQGKTVRSDFAIDQIGRNPAVLGPKDGLALINGTTVMNAMGAVAVVRAKRLAKIADIAGAMTLEGIQGTSKAFHELISSLKPHPGQINVSYNLNKILNGSENLQAHPDCGKVQDPYSLRCMPQVHGAIRQTISHAEQVLETELNSVTDNPLVFVKEDLIISGGNFHGEAIALCMDYLSMGLSELANISERRIEKMMNPTFSELPAFLIKDSGLNSGFMIAHVTAAALVSESKTACFPASVDSIPTSTDKEDHVSMGITAGRKLLQILENSENCLAIELLCAAQALDFRRPLKTSPILEKVHALIRKHIAHLDRDRILYKDINVLKELITSNELLKEAESVAGELR
jgi:histidine ammonia-lyase